MNERAFNKIAAGLNDAIALARHPQIYVDLDGTLADFVGLATEILGVPPRVFEDLHGTAEFWRRLDAHGNFFGAMQPLPGALELWAACLSYCDPIVLTKLPKTGTDRADAQKRCWVSRNLWLARFIGCRGVKAVWCKPGDILIDDWDKHRGPWEAAGGVFIHHKSAAQSVAELRKVMGR